jgi:hypothetical protein
MTWIWTDVDDVFVHVPTLYLLNCAALLMTSFFCTRRRLAGLAVWTLLLGAAVSAQVTTGTIYGRIIDSTGGVLPGVVVNAANEATGLVRSTTTDATGVYRLPGLPNGTYKVRTTLSGFAPMESTVTVNVSANVPLDWKLALAQGSETIKVTAPAPRESGHVNTESAEWFQLLPTDGRQLGTLTQLLPGVGGGFHTDTSRFFQPVAQLNGFNGRSGNNIIDGGDNNDGVVGGFSQPLPLDAIQEYTLLGQGFQAQYGQGNSVLNVITKSGTNIPQGSFFTSVRNDSMNARTFSEKKAHVAKQPYERYQYGGSFGGPIVQNRAHFFGAFERTQQDTQQVVNTKDANGVPTLPGDGTYSVPFRQYLITGKVTTALDPRNYLSVRYARDHETQPSGVAGNAAASTWATSANTYNSLNVNHNWQTGRSSLNEFVFQYSSYLNDTPAVSDGPAFTLLSGAKGGANANSPQSTDQKRWQFRDDYSWTNTLAGSSHEFRTGVNIIHTPRLFISSEGGTQGILGLRSNDVDGGVDTLMIIGGTVQSNIPTNRYGMYFQDNWRATPRLTVNLGVRYDYVSGIPIEQTSANFLAMQAAGQTGRFDGTFLQDFGKTPQGDRNNIQPRLGGVYDLRGDGKDLLRANWGIYTDASFTNANVLTSSLEGGGIIFSDSCSLTSSPKPYCDPARGFVFPVTNNPLNNPLYTTGASVSSLIAAGLPVIVPTAGEVVSPRLQQPFSYQTNAGWTHELPRQTTLSVDYVRVQGRDINMRIRPNVDTDPSAATLRYLAGVGVSPNSSSFRTAVSAGRSEYNALIIDGRKRMSNHVDVDASYTLSKAVSDVGTGADELTQNLLQDINNPFSAFQLGPSTRVDARHRVTASGIVQLPFELRAAATVMFHTALPVTTLEGQDLNADGVNNDHTTTAYRYTSLNADGTANFEADGTCKTVNCSRRAPFSQVNLRVSRSFRLAGTARIEAMAEVFNVFNALNPFLPLSTTRLNNAQFMQPTAYAGDAGQGEQRLGQLGLRITF